MKTHIIFELLGPSFDSLSQFLSKCAILAQGAIFGVAPCAARTQHTQSPQVLHWPSHPYYGLWYSVTGSLLDSVSNRLKLIINKYVTVLTNNLSKTVPMFLKQWS